MTTFFAVYFCQFKFPSVENVQIASDTAVCRHLNVLTALININTSRVKFVKFIIRNIFRLVVVILCTLVFKVNCITYKMSIKQILSVDRVQPHTQLVKNLNKVAHYWQSLVKEQLYLFMVGHFQD